MSDSTPGKGIDPRRVRLDRRTFLTRIAAGGAFIGLGGGSLALVGGKAAQKHTGRKRMLWQINPWKCTQCGRCATECVLDVSAVKCVHDLAMCGFCDLCTGFFRPDPGSLNTGAENQLCPTGAINRKFVEDPYYEYTIDEGTCVGCGLCVKGCTQFGNGSLYLQVRHDRCLNCNECSIARACASDAFILRPAEDPYIIKSRGPSQI